MYASGDREDRYQNDYHLGDKRSGEVADDSQTQGAEGGRRSDEQGEDHRSGPPKDRPERNADERKRRDRKDEQITIEVIVHVDEGDVGPGEDNTSLGVALTGPGNDGPKLSHGPAAVGGALSFALHLQEDGGGLSIAAEQVVSDQAVVGEALPGELECPGGEGGQGLGALDGRQGPELFEESPNDVPGSGGQGVVSLDSDDGDFVAGKLVEESAVGAVGGIVAGDEGFEAVVVAQAGFDEQCERSDRRYEDDSQDKPMVVNHPLEHPGMLSYARRERNRRVRLGSRTAGPVQITRRYLAGRTAAASTLPSLKGRSERISRTYNSLAAPGLGSRPTWT